MKFFWDEVARPGGSHPGIRTIDPFRALMRKLEGLVIMKGDDQIAIFFG